ncbi:hypothetical protein ymoll0001_40990 [Yersinia mollaretii ATCC 43969]|uniref:Uncharacterized protein n=1 Tax=Yersinia mollaretii (strain ATCC 43969 / DSM 18520 / CIP 103324 / CNY 7263 / WAIP 204) TaxID=349967 RepID=A0ABP2E8N8_YERMW|nr:hypothetical protein ymoll0001_40990 [Yersinia mollaretii ATCC 43969]
MEFIFVFQLCMQTLKNAHPMSRVFYLKKSQLRVDSLPE